MMDSTSLLLLLLRSFLRSSCDLYHGSRRIYCPHVATRPLHRAHARTLCARPSSCVKNLRSPSCPLVPPSRLPPRCLLPRSLPSRHERFSKPSQRRRLAGRLILIGDSSRSLSKRKSKPGQPICSRKPLCLRSKTLHLLMKSYPQSN